MEMEFKTEVNEYRMAIQNLRKLLLQDVAKKIKQGLRLWADLSFRRGMIIAKRYRILEKLGSGSYGVAYLCRDIRSNRQCVMKRVSPLRGGSSRAELIYARETKMMSLMRHKAIPDLYETFRYRGHLCFTMEYMKGYSLDYLLFQENQQYTEKQALLIVKKLLPVMEYMHSLGVVHRDISIANVLADGGEIRLIDLGLSRQLSDAEWISGDKEDIDDDDPTEKKLRRAIHVTSDFYAAGHLLLFLLYSSYSEKKTPPSEEELGWEQELSLSPGTTKLLRRLLMTEQPYDTVRQIRQEIELILRALDAAY